MVYNGGGQTFLLAGQIYKKISTAGHKKTYQKNLGLFFEF